MVALLTLVLAHVQVGSPQQILLPRPPSPSSGRRPVAYRVLHLTDSTRRISFPVPDRDRRQLVVQVWYPSRSAARGVAGPYLPDPGLGRALEIEGGVASATVLAWEG